MSATCQQQGCGGANEEDGEGAAIGVTKSNVLHEVIEVMNSFDYDIDNSWIMQPDGSYNRLPGSTGNDNFERLAKYYSEIKVEPIKKGIFAKIFAR